MDANAPVVSILLPTDSLATVRSVLAEFRTQAGSERVELVLTVPRGTAVAGDEPELEGFGSVQIVEVEQAWNVPAARARAIRAARAPLVVFAETHSYPRPGYLQALVTAHENPWAVVGPVITNANPQSLVSWACLLLDYGPWLDRAERGPHDDVPGHNAAYKRDVLTALGARLDELVAADNLMHAELRAAGHELAMEPDAVVEHLNVSRFSAAMRERFEAGRNFAAIRARQWPRSRGLAYALGSPLIPIVRLRRALAHIRRVARSSELLPQLLPVLSAALVVSAAGEALGYAFRTPGNDALLFDLEMHKMRYLRRSDQELWERRDA